MTQRMYTILASTCLTALVLSGCGMYVGSPPKTEVHESSTTTAQPPTEVHVYNPP
jgi:hypothetical protein